MNRGDLAEERHAPLFAGGLLTGRSVLAQNNVGHKKGLRKRHQNRNGHQENCNTEQLQVGFHFSLSGRPLLVYTRPQGEGFSLKCCEAAPRDISNFQLDFPPRRYKVPAALPEAHLPADSRTVTTERGSTSINHVRSWDGYSHFRSTRAVFDAAVWV